MIKYKTNFDKSFRKEEKDFLIDNVIDKQAGNTKMLLRSYSTEIFEPRAEELISATEENCNQFIKATSDIRKKMRARHFSLWESKRVMACAASFAAICCLALFFSLNGRHGGSGNIGENPQGIGEFRGQASGSTAQQSGMLKIDDSMDPLAYLVDANGKVLIMRNNVSIEAENSCEVLYADDVVSLEDKSTAKVMYEDSFFDIAGPNDYQIASPSPLKVGAGNSRQVVEPSFTTRGAGYTNPVNTVAIAPKMLIAQIAAPITRASGDNINVYSPHGASFSNTPNISIGGDEKETYTVSVLDLMGDTYGKTIQLKGKSSVSWNEISNEQLQPDEIYSLKVDLNGKIVNDANNASFWLISEEETAKIKDAIKRFDNLESREPKDFFKANVLYVNGCYAEAREIALKLNSQNQIYANLVKLCNKALDVK